VLIDNFNGEFTTFIPEEQLICDNETVFVDSKNTSVHEKSSRCISSKFYICYEITSVEHYLDK
jgi:hypothetical protein